MSWHVARPLFSTAAGNKVDLQMVRQAAQSFDRAFLEGAEGAMGGQDRDIHAHSKAHADEGT